MTSRGTPARSRDVRARHAIHTWSRNASSSDRWLALAGGSLQNGFCGRKVVPASLGSSRAARLRAVACVSLFLCDGCTRARGVSHGEDCSAVAYGCSPTDLTAYASRTRWCRVALRGAPTRCHVWCLRAAHAASARVMQAIAIVYLMPSERLLSLGHERAYKLKDPLMFRQEKTADPQRICAGVHETHSWRAPPPLTCDASRGGPRIARARPRSELLAHAIRWQPLLKFKRKTCIYVVSREGKRAGVARSRGASAKPSK